MTSKWLGFCFSIGIQWIDKQVARIQSPRARTHRKSKRSYGIQRTTKSWWSRVGRLFRCWIATTPQNRIWARWRWSSSWTPATTNSSSTTSSRSAFNCYPSSSSITSKVGSASIPAQRATDDRTSQTRPNCAWSPFKSHEASQAGPVHVRGLSMHTARGITKQVARITNNVNIPPFSPQRSKYNGMPI